MGRLAAAYFANDRVSSLTQSGHTKTYTVDAANRVRGIADTAGPTLTNHYTDSTDTPSWTGASDGT